VEERGTGTDPGGSCGREGAGRPLESEHTFD
jgi:hypothetical protein